MEDDWTTYEPDGRYIPMDQWGKDHWATFAYLETRIVDHGGMVDNARMRCHARLHRPFAEDRGFGIMDGSQHATRLKEGKQLDHDDWSCLEDMVAAGLIVAEFRVKKQDLMVGHCEAHVQLTAEGERLAPQLRRHKAAGGDFGSFTPTPAEATP